MSMSKRWFTADKKYVLLLLPLLAVVGSFANDQDNTLVKDPRFQRGQELSQNCIGCHGVKGIAPVPDNPNLAGQNYKYIVYALKAYRAQKRTGGLAFIMHSNAGALTDQNIKDLAYYFSNQQGRQAFSDANP